MRLFDRFDKVYCVNLDRRPDRLENFENQVKKLSLKFAKFTTVLNCG
jgi:hypothetical protein